MEVLAQRTQDEVFESSVRAQLEVIETALRNAAEADSDMVTEAAQHIIAAGGKRFRPLLVVLGSHLGPYADADDVVKAAVVVELTHVASLYHDDVVADLGPDFVRIQARTFSRLVQGQIAETVGPRGTDPLDHYLTVVADKTGSLIATSALFGSKISGAAPQLQRVMADFGEQIGVVFQLSDDIIDITSDATGKMPGTDLREGIPTLPTILARRSADPADARLLELLDCDLHDDDALREVLDLLRHHRSIDQARREVRRRAEAARALLVNLPRGPARDALDDLCTTVVTRTA